MPEESMESFAPEDVEQLVFKSVVVGLLMLEITFKGRRPRPIRRRNFSQLVSIGQTEKNWDSLPEGVREKIVAGLPFQQLFQFRAVSKEYRGIINKRTFQQARWQRFPTEGMFKPLVFFTDPMNGWHWVGFDLKAKKWCRLPPLSFLQTPDPGLFKEFSVAGSGGLLCVNVSKQPGVEQIIVCNPLTRDMRKLQPMNFPRQPMLMTLLLDKDTNNYKVIVAGARRSAAKSFLERQKCMIPLLENGKW